MKAFGRVVELWRYPVSSMGGETLTSAEIVEGGIPGDRIWGVLDKRDTQIAYPEKRKHWRPLPNLHSRLGDDEPAIAGTDANWFPVSSPEAGELVSRFMDFPIELRPHVPFGTEAPGRIAPRYQRADLHVLTTASMAALAKLLPDPDEVDTRRFRPNVLIETDDGWDGFVERGIIGSELTIGTARVVVTEPCARCAFTALAQGDLAFEPAVLHKIAQHGEGGFGGLCRVVRAGQVRIGDVVTLAAG